mgnify:CR=1 FL=1
MNYICLLAIIIGMTLLLLIGAKKEKNDPMNKETSIAIKGFMAILIMVNHLLMYLFGNCEYVKYLVNLSSIAVGIFFFYSGYGLYTQVKEDKQYLKNFVINKVLLKLYVPFVIVNLFFYIIFKLNNVAQIGIEQILTMGFVIGKNWFVIEIMIYYCIFWVIFKIFNTKKAYKISILCYLTSIVFMIALDYKYNIGTWWYISSIGFIIGMMFSENKEKILSKIDKQNKKFFLINSFVIIILYILACNAMEISKIINIEKIANYITVLTSMLIIPSSLLFFVQILSKIKMKNKINLYMGKISYEIYNVHLLFKIYFINIVGQQDFSMRLVVFFVIILETIITSIIINKIAKSLYKKFKVT